jgi:hypothetical protein
MDITLVNSSKHTQVEVSFILCTDLQSTVFHVIDDVVVDVVYKSNPIQGKAVINGIAGTPISDGESMNSVRTISLCQRFLILLRKTNIHKKIGNKPCTLFSTLSWHGSCHANC